MLFRSGLSSLLAPVFDAIGKKAEAFAPKLEVLADGALVVAPRGEGPVALERARAEQPPLPKPAAELLEPRVLDRPQHPQPVRRPRAQLVQQPLQAPPRAAQAQAPVAAAARKPEVAARRGFRQKGGDLDFEKAAHTLLTDYRSGILGRISLETPASLGVVATKNQQAAVDYAAWWKSFQDPVLNSLLDEAEAKWGGPSSFSWGSNSQDFNQGVVPSTTWEFNTDPENPADEPTDEQRAKIRDISRAARTSFSSAASRSPVSFT